MAIGRARYDVVGDGIEFSLRQQRSDHNPADLHYERVDNVYAVIPHYEEFTANEVHAGVTIIVTKCY